MRQWICLALCLEWASLTNAMVQVHDLVEPTVKFYRTPSSPFPSGESTLKVLSNQKINSRLETWFWVDSGVEKDWVPAYALIYLRDFFEQSPTAQTGLLTTDTKGLRLKSDWRPSELLKEGSEITITSVRSDWACGTDKKGDLCVPTEKVLLAIDGAQRVQTNAGQWHEVKYRSRQHIVTKANKLILINKIKSWEANPNIAFIRSQASGSTKNSSPLTTLLPYTRVQILKKEMRRWFQSILPEHGYVWWQNTVPSELESGAIILSREELQNRKIFDQSNHSKFSLVASDGIFFSKDGETWSLLKQFGDANQPVTIGPRETLVVGDQLSFDEGKTFQNYLRWDQIAVEVQHRLKHAPQYMRLVKVKPLGRSSLTFDIDTGYKVLRFEFNTINSQILYQQSYLKR